jgi:hypothetical protein
MTSLADFRPARAAAANTYERAAFLSMERQYLPCGSAKRAELLAMADNDYESYLLIVGAITCSPRAFLSSNRTP